MIDFNKNEKTYEPMFNNVGLSNNVAIENGLQIVEHSTANMSVDYNSGVINWKGEYIEIQTSGNLIITPSDTTNDRLDLIVINSTGNISVINGSPSSDPLTPTYNIETLYPLAIIKVNANVTAIVNNDIIDCRVEKKIMASTGLRNYNKTSESDFTINHNLGIYPNVICIKQISSSVWEKIPENEYTTEYTDLNNIRLHSFTNSPFTGVVSLIGGSRNNLDNTKLALDGSNRMTNRIKYAGFSTLVNSQYNITNSETKIVDSTNNTKTSLIQNLGSDIVYIGASNVSSTNGIELQSGESYEYNSESDLYCISAGTSDIRILKVRL